MKFKKILLLFTIIISTTSLFSQVESKNGIWTKPKDTIRVFLVFAEPLNDPHYADNPTGNGNENWQPGQMPTTAANWFDHEFTGAENITNHNTKYFYQASLGKFIVLGDYYPELIQIEYDDLSGGHSGSDENIFAFLDNLPGNDIITANGLSFNSNDFDKLTETPNGLPIPNQPDGNIDMIMMIWRVNSKLGEFAQSAGSVDDDFSRAIKNKNGFLVHSRFIKRNASPTSGFRHEFSHALLGLNNFHIVSGGGSRKILSNPSGWSLLSSWGNRGAMCNAWDRWRLDWKPNETDHAIRAINPDTSTQVNSDLIYGEAFPENTQEFILRDFVSTGDALRIKLPYLKSESTLVQNQYMWLENHQLINGNIDLNRTNTTKGIYSYIQIGKVTLSGSATFSEKNNYLFPVNAFGNYDIETNVENTRTPCTDCNTTFEEGWLKNISSNGNINIDTNKLNPFTGGNLLLRVPVNTIDPDQFGANFYYNTITRSEVMFVNSVNVNGTPLPSTDFSNGTSPSFGTRHDAFTVGRKINIGSNPPSTPRQTFETKGGVPFEDSRDWDNNKIFLNGLSIEILEQYANGDVRVKISYNKYDIEEDTRWCGDIVLNEKVNLLEGKTIDIDHGLYPTRARNPIIFQNEKTWTNPTVFTCNSGSEFTQNENTTVTVKNSSTLHLKGDSTYIIEDGATLIIEKSNTLKIDACAKIIINGTGQLIINDESNLEIEDGAILAFENALQNVLISASLVIPSGFSDPRIYLPPSYSITASSPNWDNKNYKIFRDLTIEDGANLKILNSTISFNEETTKVVVNPNSKLRVIGSTLTALNACNGDNLWQGITVKGNYTLPQTDENQGILEMTNGAVIEYAKIAVLGADISFNRSDDDPVPPVDPPLTGGFIRIDNAIFRDNIIGVEIPAYSFNNASYIKNSLFETTEYLANANQIFRNFISLSEVGTIEISDNQFKNVPIDPNSSPELFRSQGRGIVAFNSKVEIYNNSFENLYKAIQIEGTFTGLCVALNCINTNIYTNNFTDNWNAIQLNSTKNATIISNNIKVFPFMQNGGAFSSSGLYITNSKAFHIENNDIFANTASFTNGIFIRDCNSVNQIYKNDFHKLYTAIYASGNNRKPKAKEGLQIICNAFTNNSNDIYIAPNSIFPTEVGFVEESAGNTFLPICDNPTESARQFNNLSGNQITYLGINSPEYLPSCNNNLNVVSVTNQNACSDLITRIGTFEELLAFDNEIIDKKSMLLALTDGGDTEGLTETVEEAEENQALRLRNNLLRKSPTLSDTVMVSSTFREEILPSVMLKQVLAANPKAAKSTKVQNALDDRANLLPDYMREEINLGKNNLSFIETVASNLSKAMHQREITVDLIIRRLTREDTETASNQLKDLLINESQNNVQRKYQLVNYYLSINESQNAQTVFSAIPQNFELSSLEQNDYDQRASLFNMKLDLLSNNKSWFNINQGQYTTINTLAIDSISTASMQARAILSLIDRREYGLPIPALEIDARQSTNTITNYNIFEVTPNVATNYFIINYALDTKETVKEVTFEVYNNNDKKMLTKNVKTRENQFLTECTNWREGIYWCKKVVNGRMAKEKQFIIKRGKTPIINNLNESFKVYPNPTDNHFFVDFNIFNIKNTNIQITDVKGSIIQSLTVAKNTNKINVNTKSWQSGVYFVSLLSNNKLIKTVKVVIK